MNLCVHILSRLIIFYLELLVVFDDVDHVQPAPDRMAELAQPDGRRVAVARHADVDEIAVGQIGARRHGRHAAVNAVETMRAA